MYSEIQFLVKHKLLKTHPNALNMCNFWDIANTTYYGGNIANITYYDGEIKDDLKFSKTDIKLFNDKVCSVCNSFNLSGFICGKCNKYICHMCRTTKEFCENCIDKCSVCKSFPSCYSMTTLIKCESCNEYFCVDDFEDTIHANRKGKQIFIRQTTVYVNNKCYSICKKKCSQIYYFWRKQVIISLNRLFRKKQLIDTFKLYNIKIRSDSALCSNYIDGILDKEWTSEKVADKMCEMKYLFEHCNLKDYIRYVTDDEINEWREEKNETKNGLFPVSNERFYVAKQKLLNDTNNYLPIVWPWKANYKDNHRIHLKQVLNELSVLPPICGSSTGGYLFIQTRELNKHLFKN